MGQANSSKRELSRGFKKTDGSSKLKPSGKKKTIADGLVHEYKAVTFAEAAECRETFLDFFGNSQFHLSPDEFDDVFGPIFHDTAPHYKLFKGRVFHVFAAAYLFSTEQFKGLDSKVEALFGLFDFDNNNCLNRVEMEMLFECVTEAIHKVTKTKHPNRGCELTLVRRCFRDVSPGGGEVKIHEFQDWLGHQEDIIQYLDQFINARFVTALQEELLAAVSSAYENFVKLSDEETDTITQAQFTEILTQTKFPATETETTEVIKLLKENGGLNDRSGQHGIKEQAFRAMIVPWLSVSIMDTDHNGHIDIGELKCLMWVHQEQGTPEPKDDVVRRTMAKLDLDFSGGIDRMEWVAHNAECDIASGNMVPSKASMTLFRKIDNTVDANRRIQITVVRKQITEQATQACAFALDSLINPKDKEELVNLISNIGVDIISEIDPHDLGYTTMQAVHEAKHTIELKLHKLAKYAVTLAKVEVQEAQLKHELVMDFQDMGKQDSNFEMANRRMNRKQGSVR